MRPLRLARIAAEAEGLRLRHAAQRTAIRAVLGLLALGFVFGAVTFCHVAAWYWLRQSWEGPAAALIMAGADLIVALLLGLLAARSRPSHVEIEALAVRRQALQSATSSLAFSALAAQLLRTGISMFRRARS